MIVAAPASRPTLKTSAIRWPSSRPPIAKKIYREKISSATVERPQFKKLMAKLGAGDVVVDTTSDFADQVLAMLGVVAKFERRRIMKRTARGRDDAKANGVKFGRKPKLTPHRQREARKRIEDGTAQRTVARSYNVSQTPISRLRV